MAIADSLGIDAYKPAQIAARVEEAGVAKARLAIVPLTVLGILAGAFIAFGAMLFTLVMTDHGLGFGPARLLGGMVFALGLILVVIAGAELFTGNNLIVMARIDGRIGTGELVRNWVVVFLANFIGAFGAAILVALSGTLAMHGGAVMETAAAIARSKVALSVDQAFFRAILCNALVCLAVWLSFAARDVAGKILAIVPPVAAFVALGFEHSIANIYFIGLALVTGVEGVTLAGFVVNLLVVTIGNVIGGGGLVGLAYWFCYRMGAPDSA
ncbi:MAG: formate/nitrite transporter family protein [Geminicoccaceae bacterium]